MKRLKSHFVFNRSERNGIFVLVLLIVGVQALYFLVDFSPDLVLADDQQEKVARLQRKIDSLKLVKAAEPSLEIYPFNPNFISDYRGYLLGMSVEEIDRLHVFRSKGLWIRGTVEFQQVTGVSDSLLQLLAPYFKFPVFATPKAETLPVVAQTLQVQDLNRATPEALLEVYGIGEVLSQRIVRYRESIGGFISEVQLYDVYGLSPEVAERVLERFKILDPIVREKQDLNSISILALSEIPGFTYELAREVVEYRSRHKGIKSFEELGNIKDFPAEKIDRFRLYLAIDEEREFPE